MQVFLTSATGYVGAAVAARLQVRGHSVAALARSAASEERLQSVGIRPVPGNLARPETYRDEAASADAVAHTAFEYSADGAENLDLDLQATRALLRARRLIYTSNAYRPRIEVERLLASATSAAAIRVGMVYGGYGGGTIASLFATARRSGHLPYLRDAANNRWSLIHLDDLARLYARLLETNATGVFNGVDGQPLSVRRTLERAAAVCGVSASMKDEAFVTSVHEQHTVDVMKRDVAADSSEAHALDWSPYYRSFEEGAAAAHAEWCAQ
jgi:nucleoside-diphosphate-sugar epimerase